MSWITFDPAGKRVRLVVYVQPNARMTAVAGRHGEALKIRVAAPAIDNKANAMLIEFLHQALDYPLRSMRITRGHASRNKVVEIDEGDPQRLAAIQNALETP